MQILLSSKYDVITLFFFLLSLLFSYCCKQNVARANTCGYLHVVPVISRWSVVLQVPDLLRQVTHGNLSVQFRIRIFEIKIPAGWIQINLQVNSWWALGWANFRSIRFTVMALLCCLVDNEQSILCMWVPKLFIMLDFISFVFSIHQVKIMVSIFNGRCIAYTPSMDNPGSSLLQKISRWIFIIFSHDSVD